MSEISLRPATANDVGAIRNCLASAYANAMRDIDDLPDVTGGILDDINTHQVLIAEDAEHLLGVIISGKQSDAIMIFNLGVSSNAQGRGVARRLLDAVEASADVGHCILRLRTHRLMTNTRAMYLHLGWQEVETSGNTVLMEKHVA